MSESKTEKQLVLYDYPISYNCQIVRLALCEKGIPGQTKAVDIGPLLENFRPWFMRINPKGLVPVIEHNGRFLTEAIDIIRYLDSNFPGPKLTPPGDDERAIMDEWIALERGFPEGDFTYGLVEQGTGKIVAKDMERRKKQLNDYMLKNPDLAVAYQTKIQHVIDWQDRLRDQTLVDGLIEKLGGMLEKLEERVQGREYILDSGYSLADVVWTAFLGRLEMLGFKRLWSFGARPNLENYYIRLKRRPSFLRAPIFLKSSIWSVIISACRAFWPQILAALGVVAAIIAVLVILT
ncbi:MAG: glutathione S-transferase family protein [Proteobacteria bacterium]|nr:glutathione S-transferase family protein [Pseudomonadota bacterium]